MQRQKGEHESAYVHIGKGVLNTFFIHILPAVSKKNKTQPTDPSFTFSSYLLKAKKNEKKGKSSKRTLEYKDTHRGIKENEIWNTTPKFTLFAPEMHDSYESQKQNTLCSLQAISEETGRAHRQASAERGGLVLPASRQVWQRPTLSPDPRHMSTCSASFSPQAFMAGGQLLSTDANKADVIINYKCSQKWPSCQNDFKRIKVSNGSSLKSEA